MATLGERIESVREVVEERHTAHRRLGLPQVQTVRDALQMLERQFAKHPVLISERDPWCRTCLVDWPCDEVRVAETMLSVIEDTETKELDDGR